MPRPTAGDVHVNRPLTNVLVGWIQAESRYIALEMFPEVPVESQTDIIPQYSQADLLRDDAEERAPGTEAAGGGFNTDNTDTYLCKPVARKHDIPDPIRANQTQPYDLDRQATRIVAQKIAIKRETDFVSAHMTASVWDIADFTPGTKWDAAGSTPFEDIRGQMDLIDINGFPANAIAFSKDVWSTLADHPDIVDRIKGGSTTQNPAKAMPNQMAQILGLDKVLIGNAAKNSAADGAAAISMGFIVPSGTALLVHAAPAPGIMIPSAGYTFTWRRYIGAQGMRVKRFRIEAIESDRVEAQSAYGFKPIAKSLGNFFTGLLT